MVGILTFLLSTVSRISLLRGVQEVRIPLGTLSATVSEVASSELSLVERRCLLERCVEDLLVGERRVECRLVGERRVGDRLVGDLRGE